MEYVYGTIGVISIILLIVKVIIQSFKAKKLKLETVDIETAVKVAEIAESADSSEYFTDFIGKLGNAAENGTFDNSNKEVLKILLKMKEKPNIINPVDEAAINHILEKMKVVKDGK